MSEISREMNPSSEIVTGPDLFQYYILEVTELLSGNDLSPSSSKKSQSIGADNDKNRPVGFAGLFSNAVGHGISCHEKTRLLAMLRQIVVSLNREVDEMMDPVFSMHRLRGLLAAADIPPKCKDAKRKVEIENCVHKRLKVSSREGSPNEQKGMADDNKVDDDLQILLMNRGPKVAEKMEKHTAELSATLERMEKKVEELIDTVVSSCRPMTLAEKHQLRRLVENLPSQNLNRVVEILQRGKPPENVNKDDITVDLQHEDDLTMWRIYFYVKAVENAHKLL